MPQRHAGMEGKEPGCTERHPFYDAELISVYTSSQAVADGIKIQLGQRLWCTTNFARTVASNWFVRKGTEVIAGPFASSGEAMHHVHNLQPQSAEWAMTYEDLSIAAGIDRDVLRQIVSGIVSEYVSGAYAVPKRADEYGEADAELASYLVEPGRGLVDEAAPASEQEVKVWAIGDPEGLHILLPEDY
ncbi:MAG: hypothetical protein QOG21_151 [Actinomycetota bacterium]|nr:hypothetical protein [Actinomycetota bacterium]